MDLNEISINFLLKPYKTLKVFWKQISSCPTDQICSSDRQQTCKRAPRCPGRYCLSITGYLGVSMLPNVTGPWDKTKYCLIVLSLPYSWQLQIVLPQKKYKHSAGNNLLQGTITKVSWWNLHQVFCAPSAIDSFHSLPSCKSLQQILPFKYLITHNLGHIYIYSPSSMQ